MKIFTKKRLDNKGAALVMAILVIAFVSILTTVLLYLANMNYQMKSTDFKTKDVFYNAEIALETIRSRMVMDVADASADAYDVSVLNYANVDSSVRASEFQKRFYDSVISMWKDRCKNGTNEWDWVHGLEQLYSSAVSPIGISEIHVIYSSKWTGTACQTSGCKKPYHLILDETIAGDERLKVHTETIGGKKVDKLKLRGVKLIFTKNEFTSIIETNYNIVPPKVDLSIDNFDSTPPTEAVERSKVDFETCVTYVGYKKQ